MNVENERDMKALLISPSYLYYMVGMNTLEISNFRARAIVCIPDYMNQQPDPNCRQYKYNIRELDLFLHCR